MELRLKTAGVVQNRHSIKVRVSGVRDVKRDDMPRKKFPALLLEPEGAAWRAAAADLWQNNVGTVAIHQFSVPAQNLGDCLDSLPLS